MEKKAHRKGRVGFVLLLVLCLILLLIAAFLFWTARTGYGTGESPNLFGWSLYSVTTEDGSVSRNAAVLTQRDIESAERDEAVVYRNASKMHMAYFEEMDGDYWRMSDKDGGNPVLVPAGNVRGRAVRTIAGLGMVIRLAQGEYGMFIFGGVCVLLLALLIVLILLRYKKTRAREDGDLLFMDDEYAQGGFDEEEFDEAEFDDVDTRPYSRAIAADRDREDAAGEEVDLFSMKRAAERPARKIEPDDDSEKDEEPDKVWNGSAEDLRYAYDRTAREEARHAPEPAAEEPAAPEETETDVRSALDEAILERQARRRALREASRRESARKAPAGEGPADAEHADDRETADEYDVIAAHHEIGRAVRRRYEEEHRAHQAPAEAPAVPAEESPAKEPHEPIAHNSRRIAPAAYAAQPEEPAAPGELSGPVPPGEEPAPETFTAIAAAADSPVDEQPALPDEAETYAQPWMQKQPAREPETDTPEEDEPYWPDDEAAAPEQLAMEEAYSLPTEEYAAELPAEEPAAELPDEEPTEQEAAAFEQADAAAPDEKEPSMVLSEDEGFDMRIDSPAPAAPDAPPLVTGSLRTDTAKLAVSGEEKDLERLARMIEKAVQDRGHAPVTLDTIYGEETSLEICCSWADVGLISALVAQMQR